MVKKRIISIITLCIAVVMVTFSFMGDRWEVFNTFKALFITHENTWYQSNAMTTFTFINSFFTGMIGLILIPVSIYTIGKDCVAPKWVGLLKTIGAAINIFVFTGTFFGLVIMAIYQKDFIAAWDYTFAGGGFYTHFLNPIAIIVVFFISVDEIKVSNRSFLFCLIPPATYFIIYFIMVFGFDVWWDIYALKDVVKVVGNLFGSPAVGAITVGLIYLIVNWYVVAMYQLLLYWKKGNVSVSGVPLTEKLAQRKALKESK